MGLRDHCVLVCKLEFIGDIVQVLLFLLHISFSTVHGRFGGAATDVLRLQFLLEGQFPLMQATELVDLVLIFSAHLRLVAGGRSLVFFG